MGLRILWFSNAPWTATGYGQQTAQAWWRLARLGHTVVAIATNYGHEGAALTIDSHGQQTFVWPRGFAPHGNDIIEAHAKAAKADIVISLYDTWIFDPRTMIRMKWCPWLPVDMAPCPPAVVNVLQSAYQPIAYSQFGMRMLTDAGLDPAYVPHGIESSVFKPGDKQAARGKLGLGDNEFVAVMVAANKGQPSRKAFPEVFAAWAAFVKEHPRAVLYLHTIATEEMHGLNLHGQAKLAGIPPENLRFADTYGLIMGYPQEFLAEVYQAADVLLSPSYGEGFGVPIIEAQACGCPVIVNDCTSMPELCFGGWKTANQPYATPLLAYQFRPEVASIAHCLELAWSAKDNADIKRLAIAGAGQYDADLVAETYWRPVLAKIEAEIKAPKDSGAKVGIDLEAAAT